jgi:predicted regulator of Ras-like GTPase activity (Roadblock/LC7/MglB family)
LHKNNLRYILIEGQKAKILLTPLKNSENPTLNRIIEAQGLQGNDDEFFMAITTQPMVNLGGIFLKTRQALIDIKKSLIISGESFKPPLRHFSEDEMKKMLDSFNTIENLNHADKLDLISLSFSEKVCKDLNDVLKEFGSQVLDLISTFITIEGGHMIANFNNNSLDTFACESGASMSSSLFYTADKCAWFLRKMHIDSILLECDNYFQFVQKVENGIFSVLVAKGRQKLGLLRLILPRYCNKIAQLLQDAKKVENQKIPTCNFKSMFGELIL